MDEKQKYAIWIVGEEPRRDDGWKYFYKEGNIYGPTIFVDYEKNYDKMPNWQYAGGKWFDSDGTLDLYFHFGTLSREDITNHGIENWKKLKFSSLQTLLCNDKSSTRNCYWK